MLKGSKVVLGPLEQADATAMFRWLNDVDAAALDLAYRPTDWVTFRTWTESLPKETSRVVFAVRKTDAHPIIGFAGLSNINSVHRSAELAVRIGDEANRNGGLGTEAARLCMEFGWKHLNLHRIALTALAGNERAIRSFELAGLQREGLARSAAFIDGRWHDVVIMGALRPIPA